jgi:molybdate transport system ATP-binding protein
MPEPAQFTSPSRSLSVRIRKSLPSLEREFTLDVEFDAPPGFTILFGPSGSGKTTLLDCVSGIATPHAGRIAAGQRILFDSSARVNLSPSNRGVGYVFQDLALFPHLTVAQNIEYGLASLPRALRRQRAHVMLQSFRIEHLHPQRPAQMSGGERQRVALARALVTDPCVLLLDEPLAALDAATKAKILDDLRSWNRDHRVPILYVTHSREEVMALGERVLVLDRGRIIAQGTPHEVMRAPSQETVAQLAGFENIFDASVESIHEDRGTMMCRLYDGPGIGTVTLETPLIRSEIGSHLRVGIRAGDILLAVQRPEGLSARNIIRGQVVSRERRDMMIAARVNCGVEMEVFLTLAARDSLQLEAGREVWLVIKTYSCHLMRS